MTGDDPYQAPQSLEGPDKHQALSFSYWTHRKIFVLFLTPTIFAVVFRLTALYLPSLYSFTFFPPILIFIGLGVNCKLTAICAKTARRSGIERFFDLVFWFIIWGMAQLILNSISLILFKKLLRLIET